AGRECRRCSRPRRPVAHPVTWARSATWSPWSRFGCTRRARAASRASSCGRCTAGLARTLDRAVDLTLIVGGLLRLALVVLLLVRDEPELDFHAMALEVHRQRDQRVAALLDLGRELVDLVLVQEQLAHAVELVPPPV